MLPSVGFAEMLVLALLAIIVVGPRDLPKLMRTLGEWTGRIRAMGNEFKAAFDDMDRDSEVAEMRREIQELKKLGTLDPDVDSDLVRDMVELDSELRHGTDVTAPTTPKSPKTPTSKKPE